MACGAGDAALFATFLRRTDRQSVSKNPIGRMLGDLARNTPTSTGKNAHCMFSRRRGASSAQGQEQEEIRQGQIHSDSGKADLENQGQNERAERCSFRQELITELFEEER